MLGLSYCSSLFLWDGHTGTTRRTQRIILIRTSRPRILWTTGENGLTIRIHLCRFVNGDPTNDDINGTAFEHDISSNQMRHGGDLQGLLDTLDYIAGMGVKVSRDPQEDFEESTDHFT